MTLLPVHCALLACTAALVNHHVPNPYMDEIFHIPQAQRYCVNDFATWDPKLTTPPGLYLISRFIFQCNTTISLRMLNLVFAACLYPVIHRILTLHHPTGSNHLFTLALVWFPVGFFYNFLYYTDSGSTLFVLLSYLLAKQNHYTLSGLSGFVSLMFRQTNVIWICFIMAVSMMDIIGFKDNRVGMEPVQRFVVESVRQLPRWMIKLWTFVLTIAAFALFLVWNDGIVLGDRSHHIAILHVPQMFYFSSYLSFFAAPWILTKESIQAFFSPTGKRCLGFLVAGAILFYLVHHCTYEHPFLLNDNRHYTFYVWKNIYRRHWSVRYLVIPLYIASGWFNWRALRHNSGFLTCMGYFVAIALTLVPSPLLEFRYFIIPFLFYAIQLKPKAWQTSIVLFMYTVLHVITVSLFLYKPFEWAHEPGSTQRFMW
ncbi:alpha-2-glucosyltransferase Alg10 [Fennellomyces sp. T-0311]|nr:alpha-2-glucosyltransferase Alg10 [Fennellomyces sp. T-0311]